MVGRVEDLNPEHVDDYTHDVPQGKHVPLVTAMARYELDAVTESDVRQLCRDVGLDSPYYLDGKSNHINVPKKVVRRLGGSGKTTEEVSTETGPEAILGRAAAASVLHLDTGDAEQIDLERMVSQAREALKQHEDEIRALTEHDETVDVMRGAMYQLVGEAEGRVLGGLGYDADEIEEINWARTPGELVDWYVEQHGGEMENDSKRGKVAAEIADYLPYDATPAIIEDDGSWVTAGTWESGAERMAASDDLPVAPMEQHLERAEAALDERPDHPAADRLREAVADFREELEERRAEAEA